MKSIKYLLILIPLLFVLIQCKKEKPEFPRPEVTTGEYNPESGTAVGIIEHLSDYVEEYGHIWGTTTPTLDTFLDRSIHTDIIIQDSVQIISNIPEFPSDSTYFIRAYVVDKFGNAWYGDVVIQYSPSDYIKACLTSSHAECEIHECGVRFDASCSIGQVTTYKWDFNGDNVFDYISDSEIADYSYTTAGTYYPRLHIINSNNIFSDTIFTLQVYETEQTLVSCFLVGTDIAELGATIPFDASCSRNAIYYEWDFDGDGLIDAHGEELITPTYTYNNSGNFTVKLSIKNDDGITATDSTLIQINPPDAVTPVACFFASITEAEAGTEIEFYASCSEDALIYRWDFDGDEDFEMGGIGIETVTHVFNEEGGYDVRLEVVSVDNITDEFTLTITISPPTLVIPTACIAPQPPASVLTSETIYFDASCSENAVNYKWNFGDGTILNGSQWEVASHAYDEPGNYIVTLAIRSIDGEEAEFMTSVIQCSTPTPIEYTFTPEPIENIYPVLIVADSEFAGGGPLVNIECTAYILNETQIYLDVYFRALEWPVQPGNGATEGLYENSLLIYTAPIGKKISAITSSNTSTASYIDNDIYYDIIPYGTEMSMTFIGELADRFEVLGDTADGDVSSSSVCPDDNCTELNIYFNPMTIQLIDE